MVWMLKLLLTTLFTGALAQSPGLLVQTSSGPVQGFLDASTTPVALNKWLGIPFAEDTSGENRWKPPVALTNQSNTIFNATAYGPACLQGR